MDHFQGKPVDLLEGTVIVKISYAIVNVKNPVLGIPNFSITLNRDLTSSVEVHNNQYQYWYVYCTVVSPTTHNPKYDDQFVRLQPSSNGISIIGSATVHSIF